MAWTRADEREVRVALDPLSAAGKPGAALVQFPWSFKRKGENRVWLGDVVSAFGQYPLVVEIRHESRNVPEFYDSLASFNSRPCVRSDTGPDTGVWRLLATTTDTSLLRELAYALVTPLARSWFIWTSVCTNVNIRQ